LWFTGVNTDVQNKGVGSNLLSEVIQEEQFALKLPSRKIFPGMKNTDLKSMENWILAICCII
jgi:hypothetical protein